MSYRSAYLEFELELNSRTHNLSLALHPLELIKDVASILFESPVVVKQIEPNRVEEVDMSSHRYNQYVP